MNESRRPLAREGLSVVTGGNERGHAPLYWREVKAWIGDDDYLLARIEACGCPELADAIVRQLISRNTARELLRLSRPAQRECLMAGAKTCRDVAMAIRRHRFRYALTPCPSCGHLLPVRVPLAEVIDPKSRQDGA